ncbi:MAG: thrombospondin type 3 repeat-containing protein [Bacteroidia bacterium]|nr:thrombospondin type 3 repeat-containing protein [Bacteroidia bacterium]
MRNFLFISFFISLSYTTEAQILSRIKNWFSPKNNDKELIGANQQNNAQIVLADLDKDGVPDKDDSCKTIPGVSFLFGCPDADGDGIADHLDACPNKAGTFQLNGCPDRDKDGIADDVDECPDKFGLAHLNGCLDTDNDGIIDHLDECPNNAGTINNKGCPEIPLTLKSSLKKIEDAIDFEKASSKIAKISSNGLTELSKTIQQYQEYRFEIYCYTEEANDAAKNQLLSTERAAAVQEFLISKGIYSKRLNFYSFSKTDLAIPNIKKGKTKTYIVPKLIYP